MRLFKHSLLTTSHLQLKEATAYAHKNGIIVKGDIAIGVYRHGADAWQNPDFLAPIEGRGTNIQVSEGGQANADLLVIPAGRQ